MWKKYQSQNKQSKQIKLAFFALGILVLLLLLAKLFSIFSSLSQPFNANLQNDKQFSWDGQSSINILLYHPNASSSENPSNFNQSKLALVNLRPQDQSIKVLHISDETYMELPKSYGSWRVGSIFDLGQEEKPQIGSKLLKLSISKLIGLPIEGLIVLNNESQDFSAEEEINSWRKNPFSTFTFVKNISTDLTPIELFKFIKSAASVRQDQITVLNLAESNITRSQLLPDSSRVLGVDVVKLDTFIRDNMEDSQLIEEDITVAVFNATSHSGIAQEASRTLTNMGINVITLSNTEKYIEKSLVLATGESETLKDSLTLQKASQFFAPDCLKKICSTDDQKVNSSRAQVTVVLGEDYYNMWYKK